MNAREIIAMLREARGPVALVRGLDGGEVTMLADLAEAGLDYYRDLVEGESHDEGAGWRLLPGPGEVSEEESEGDAVILLRAGELERDPANPRRVRLVEV